MCTEVDYTLSLHDALPIFATQRGRGGRRGVGKCTEQIRDQERSGERAEGRIAPVHLELVHGLGVGELRGRDVVGRTSRWRCADLDRKSTRLNSSHEWISYA